MLGDLRNFCEKQKLSLEKSDIEGFDYIISNTSENIGVVIKDWNRSMGITPVIQAFHSKQWTTEITKIMILTNRYSSPAASLAHHSGIILVTPQDFERNRVQISANTD